jgi:hypothetical protein
VSEDLQLDLVVLSDDEKKKRDEIILAYQLLDKKLDEVIRRIDERKSRSKS